MRLAAVRVARNSNIVAGSKGVFNYGDYMQKLIVVADHNDADYIARIEDVSDEQLNEMSPLFAAIKENNGSFQTDDKVDKNSFDYAQITGYDLFIDKFCPQDEASYGIHTIRELYVACKTRDIFRHYYDWEKK